MLNRIGIDFANWSVFSLLAKTAFTQGQTGDTKSPFRILFHCALGLVLIYGRKGKSIATPRSRSLLIFLLLSLLLAFVAQLINHGINYLSWPSACPNYASCRRTWEYVIPYNFLLAAVWAYFHLSALPTHSTGL